MVDLLAADGITLDRRTSTDKDCCRRKRPTLRLALASPTRSLTKLVGRGGFGMFYNSFENQGYGPNIGENYPFVFNFDFGATRTPPTRMQHRFAGCAGQLQHRIRRLRHGWSGRHRAPSSPDSPASRFDPQLVNAKGSACRVCSSTTRLRVAYSANLTFQYSV